jgi:hypothetical protein
MPSTVKDSNDNDQVRILAIIHAVWESQNPGTSHYLVHSWKCSWVILNAEQYSTNRGKKSVRHCFAARQVKPESVVDVGFRLVNDD